MNTSPKTETKTYHHTDAGNAERFADLYGDRFKLVIEAAGRSSSEGWIHWDPDLGVWKRDNSGAVVRAVIEMARGVQAEATIALAEAQQIADAQKMEAAVKAAKHMMESGRQLENTKFITSCLTLARAMPGMTITESDLDRDDYLLCVKNGTLDLRKMPSVLRAHAPEDFITVQVPIEYDGTATCPRWRQFLEEVFPDDDLRIYMAQFTGYCLTGDTSEHLFHLFQGSGANGKSVYLSVLRELLGGVYFQEASYGTFVDSKFKNDARYDLAAIKNARVVSTAEVRGDGSLDLQIVKATTGGESVRCRNLRGSFFEYRPRFKPILTCNAKPKIKEDTQGVWRRIRLVPFVVSFEGREDRELLDKLRAELPGILFWAVEGLRLIREVEWCKPLVVFEATQDYRDQESPITTFLAETFDTSTQEWQPNAWIREAYQSWCKKRDQRPWSDRSLFEALSGHDIQNERHGKERTRGYLIGTPKSDTPADGTFDLDELIEEELFDELISADDNS